MMSATAALSLLRRPMARVLPTTSSPTSFSFIFSKRVATMTMSTTTSTSTSSTNLTESVLSGEDKSLNRLSRTPSMYKLGKHRSNALELVNKVPPIEVSGDMAVCDGGGGALGHPVEYIKVGNRGGEAVSCIYCGLKYRQKDDGHHH